ncbi:MAG: PTS sugar transporter subunit IIA [Candidatus Cloacimonetes bacterium]|nr:PTS sugar transporter subunit IIA [Candidatus Cloacimonadota bacterium]
MWKDIIKEELIVINPQIENKEDLFEKLVNHMYSLDYILNRKKFLKTLWEREQLSNTELISGVAFPHARSNSVSKVFVSIIILKDGVDYHNPEQGKARIIFFFGCPETDNRQYLQLLAQASRLARNIKFRNQLLQAKNPAQVIEMLCSYDQELEASNDDHNYLMVVVINKTEHMSDVLSALVEIGINNASIVDSVSMARKLAYDIPVFAGLSYIGTGSSKFSNMLFCHITNPRIPQHLANLLKSNGIDLKKKGIGYIQLIKLESIIGEPEEEINI